MFKKTAIFLMLIFSLLSAVPANPEPFTVETENGSRLTLQLKGDENISWYESSDGFTVLQTKNKQFVYATKDTSGKLLPSDVEAADPVFRTDNEKLFLNGIEKKLFFSEDQLKTKRLSRTVSAASGDPLIHTDFPTIGTKRFPVILVNFADKRMTHTRQNMDSLMNGKNYTHNGAVGSVNKYYRDVSFGLFNSEFDVVGPVTIDSGYAFYGNNDDQSTGYQSFVRHAVLAADPYVNFQNYDNDGDGVVDGIYFIFAGYGESFGGADPNTIWPHRWSYYGSLNVDGKQIYDYSCSMELYGTSGTTRTTIGVICHEFGHVLGLPDFYDTDYEESGGNSGGLGRWDLMAGGSWNYSGNRPPMHNAWSRMFLNWATPVEINDIADIRVQPAHTHNDIYYFTAATSDEYFIMENRREDSWDLGIPGSGLLIFHVDQEYGSSWYNNTLNCNPDHQAFDLEEADGFGNPSASYIDGGDPFPGNSDITEFTDDTTPNAQDWAGNYSEMPILNIQEIGDTITFHVGYEGLPDDPADLHIGNISDSDISLSWHLNDSADTVLLVAKAGNEPAKPEYYHEYEIGDALNGGGTVIYKGTDTTFTYSGLTPGTSYHFGLFAMNDTLQLYSGGIRKTATTASPAFYETDFSQGLPVGWEIADVSGMGTWSTDNLENRDFGATTDSNGFVIMDSDHFGDVESLQNAELITRPFNFGLSRHVVISFEHKFVKKSISIGTLYYTFNDGQTWFQLADWAENTDGVELVELDITDHVSYIKNVRFKFSYRGNNEMYWCVDDFRIESSLDNGLSADFFAVPREGSKPLTVDFYNNSVSHPYAIDSVIWDLGADFSLEQQPQWTYTISGRYDAAVSVWTTEDESAVRNRNDYITVINDAPVATAAIDTFNVLANTRDTLNLNTVFSDVNKDIGVFSWSGNSYQLDLSLTDDTLLVVSPAASYTAQEEITLQAEDSEGLTASMSLLVWVSETSTDALPSEFHLLQNYPNPFNPVTSIEYELPVSADVNLSIYDLSGRRVADLVNSHKTAGYHSIVWNGKNSSGNPVSSGMYFYRLTANDFIRTRKMLLMK